MAASSGYVPVIDFSNFEQRKQTIAEEIRKACTEVGFYYVKNYGIGLQRVQQMFEQSQRFFSLPKAVKESAAWGMHTNNRGYVAVEREKLDGSTNSEKVKLDDNREVITGGDLKEAFNICANSNLWPSADTAEHSEIVSTFRSHTDSFFNECLETACMILSAYALALGLPQNFFDASHKNQHAEPSGTTLRFLRYPPIGQLRKPQPGQFRAGAHSDYGSITLLFQDEVGGLEVLSKTGQWVPVTPIPGTIVVNTGDLMMRWTNDLFRSTVHRVVVPDQQKPDLDRYSIAFFLHPIDDYTIECITAPTTATTTTESQAVAATTTAASTAKYPPITAGAYLLQRLQATY